MKKTLKIILVILCLCFAKLVYTTTVNAMLIKDYNNEIYNSSIAKLLYILNINENYIAYYNNGNIYYKNENYKKAIEEYEKALDKNPPEERICSVRINLALALFNNIDKENITAKTMLEELNNIQNILYKDECAVKGQEDGKDKDADKLDEEIEKLKEQFENGDPNGGGDDDPNQGGEDDPNEQPADPGSEDELKEIEEKIKEQQKKSSTERKKDLDSYENRGQEYYRGKRW